MPSRLRGSRLPSPKHSSAVFRTKTPYLDSSARKPKPGISPCHVHGQKRTQEDWHSLGYLLQTSVPQGCCLFPTAGIWEKLVPSVLLPVPLHTPRACAVVPVHAADVGTGSGHPCAVHHEHNQNGIISAYEISGGMSCPPAPSARLKLPCALHQPLQPAPGVPCPALGRDGAGHVPGWVSRRHCRSSAGVLPCCRCTPKAWLQRGCHPLCLLGVGAAAVPPQHH